MKRMQLVVISALGAAAVFILPWFVPLAGTPVAADSWAVGFNNRVAMIAMVGWWATVAFTSRGNAPGATVNRLWSSDPDNRVPILLVLGVSALSGLWAAMLAWSGTPRWGDAAFFLDRAAHMEAGRIPYRDFEFPYGPGLLYLTSWGKGLGQLVGIPAGASYYLLFAGFSIASWLMLAYVIERLGLRRRQAAWLYAVIAAYAFLHGVAYGGIQASLVRFVGPVFALLTLSRLLGGRTAAAMLGAVGLGMTAFALSPEIGIVYLVAGCVLIVASKVEHRWAVLVAHVLAPVATLWFFGGDYAASLLLFGGGGGNMPVVPSAPALLYSAAGVIVAARVVGIVGRQTALDAATTSSVAALCVLFVPAAFGRADTGHILLNGLTLFIFAAATIGIAWPMRMRGAIAAFAATGVLAFVAFPWLLLAPASTVVVPAAIRTGLLPRDGFVRIATLAGKDPVSAQHKYDAYRLRGQIASDAGAATIPTGSAAVPLGIVDDVGFKLASRGRLAADYYSGLNDVVNEGQWRRKDADLARVDWIVLPPDGVGTVASHRAERPLEDWRALLTWPFGQPVGRTVPDFRGPLLDRIETEFEPVAVVPEYQVWRRVRPAARSRR